MLFAIVATAVLITATISGVFGMAGGLILMGIYLVLLPVPQAMILHGVTQLASNGFRCWLLRRSIYWPGFGFYLLGALPMFGLFSTMTLVLDKGVVFLLLGSLPLLQLKARLSFRRPRHAISCGAIVTTAHLTAGVSGPLLDAFFLRGDLTRHQVIATKAVTQTFAHLQKLVYFGWIVAIGGDGLSPGIYPLAVICALVGTRLGRQILDRLNDRQFLKWSRSLIAGICAVYVLRGIWMLAATRL